MISAKFYAKGNQIVSYEFSGHALYDALGQDIVCAAVSSLYVTITNELSHYICDEINTDKVTLMMIDDKTDALTQALYKGCKAIEEMYPENIKCKIQQSINLFA